MPVAVPITLEKYLELEKGLVSMGFVEIPWWETAIILEPRGVSFYHVYIRGEIGFEITANGHKVRVWTSCIRAEVSRCYRRGLFGAVVSRPPGRDAGWVVITDLAGRACYFAGRTSRTKNFVETLLRRTWITQYKLRHWVICAVCGAPMEICTRSDTGGNFWGCFQREHHANGKPVWEDWDFGLKTKAKKIAEAWRKERYRYYEKKRRAEEEKRKTNADIALGANIQER
jgi:hypothetical protein